MTAQLFPALAAWLAERGHGAWSPDVPYGDDVVTAIVTGAMPAAPDRCIALTSYPSVPPVGSTNSAETIESVEFTVRGTTDDRVSRTACDAILDDLNGRGSLLLPGGIQVLNVVPRQAGAFDKGTDANNRTRHSVIAAVEYLRPTVLRPGP